MWKKWWSDWSATAVYQKVGNIVTKIIMLYMWAFNHWVIWQAGRQYISAGWVISIILHVESVIFFVED
jgi:hypothetical protein